MMQQILILMQLWFSGHAKLWTLGYWYGFASWTGQNDAQRHPKTLEGLLWLVFTISWKMFGFLIVWLYVCLLHGKENRNFKKKKINFAKH